MVAGVLCAADAPPAKLAPLPVRGIHMAAPGKKDLPALLAFVRGHLAEEGVNTLILEFNYGFNFTSRPEFADPAAPGKDDVVRFCTVRQGLRGPGVGRRARQGCGGLGSGPVLPRALRGAQGI
jgi:hypothetical protein